MIYIINKFKEQIISSQATKEEIYESIVDEMNLYGVNIIILICSAIIASIGLNINSIAIIIAAMMAPLMGPIRAIAYGVGTYDNKLAKKGLKILIMASIISISVSTIYFIITPSFIAEHEILSRTRPTIWDVIIDFVAGIASIIGLSRNKFSNIIPATSIAIDIMSPLCTIGYALAMRKWDIFLGAGYLLIENIFFIFLASYIVIKALKLNSQSKDDYENKLNYFINKELHNICIISRNIDYKNNTIKLITIGGKITNNKVEKLKKLLSDYGLANKELEIKQECIDLTKLNEYIDTVKNIHNMIDINKAKIDK